MGLISGGAYIQWAICVTKLIGLAYSWKEVNEVLYCFLFLLCFILQLKAISK